MSNFQIVVLAVFIFFIIIGVALFAGLKGNSSSDVPEIVIWGMVSDSVFGQFMSKVNQDESQPLKIRYVAKKAATFHTEFVEALATGRGPDVIILPNSLILKEYDKLLPIPYTTLSKLDFKNTFIQEAELYLTEEGTLALPFSVDPLVMYWNRDMLSTAGFARYPKTWDEVGAIATALTSKDNAANIARSGLAFGEYRNVSHAKAILASLFMQAGNPIVGYDQGGPVSTLAQSYNVTPKPAEAALVFFTQFANPTKEVYSWNRSLPTSKNAFISADLALYFGPASELADIRAKSPQLNFDVAPLPQSARAPSHVTYADMNGFAIVRNSPNASTAYEVIVKLISRESLQKWTEMTYLPPVRRDMLGVVPADPFLSIFYSSALIARGWLDPAEVETGAIFQSIVENITSGKERVGEAVTRGSEQIDNLIPR